MTYFKKYFYRFPMEMHMVHLNKKYIDHEQRALDHDYLANKDGIAVLGFLFNVSGTKVSNEYLNRMHFKDIDLNLKIHLVKLNSKIIFLF